MRHTAPRDLHDFRRGRGRVKRFPVLLPRTPATRQLDAELRSEARALGISMADVQRLILAAHFGVPAEDPNADNIQQKG